MHIQTVDVNAWLEDTKLSLDSLDASLEDQVSNLILSRLAPEFTVTTWTDIASTPKIIRTLIAMLYAAWTYDRAYGDNAEEPNTYAVLLRRTVESNIAGILSGYIVVTESPLTTDSREPVFFPTDFSSAQAPTDDNPEWGPPAFMMGSVF
jgi:hypothetical protein